MSIQIDRSKTEFITSVGVIAYPFVFPGQARLPKEGNGVNLTYSCELATTDLSKELLAAVSYVAQSHDSKNWQRHVTGPLGKLKRLEEMPGRDPDKYTYAAGKFVYGFSKVCSPKMAGMEHANLTDPGLRMEYERKVAALAPKVSQLVNWANDEHLQRISEINQERQLKGQAPHQPGEKVFIPVLSHELWGGCEVRIAGSAYWNQHKKAVSLWLEQIQLVRTGERLGRVEASPEDKFGAFAPPEDLAPAADPWAAVR